MNSLRTRYYFFVPIYFVSKLHENRENTEESERILKIFDLVGKEIVHWKE